MRSCLTQVRKAAFAVHIPVCVFWWNVIHYSIYSTVAWDPERASDVPQGPSDPTGFHFLHEQKVNLQPSTAPTGAALPAPWPVGSPSRFPCTDWSAA